MQYLKCSDKGGYYLTNEELVKEYQEGNHSALDALIAKNTGLVKYAANRYLGVARNTTLEFADLEQEGWIAFLNAVEKYQYNDEVPVKFSSFAGTLMKYHILNVLNCVICRKRKRDVSSDQIMICSTNDVIPGTDDMTLENLIADENAEHPFIKIEEQIDNEILKKDLLNVIDLVLKKGYGLVTNVLLMHYGLKGQAMTFIEIGKYFKVSSSRVQQAEFEAIKLIRRSEHGEAIMKKYKWMVFNSLEHEKEKINKFAPPDTVIDKIQTIDELLYEILGQCC